MKIIKIIEKGVRLKNEESSSILGGNTDLCSSTKFFSCPVPYNILCHIYQSCQDEYIIKPCNGNLTSCVEFYVACNREHAVCLPNVSYASPCPEHTIF